MNRNNVPSSSKHGGRGNFNPYNRSTSIPSYSGGPSEPTTSVPRPMISCMLDKTPESYPGWKLYFPLEGKN